MYKILALILLFFLSGCTLAKVQVDVVSERTSLENQVLGTYNSLSDQALLVASVRGVTPLGELEEPEPVSRVKQEGIQAMQVLAFHQDDIQNFKRLRWVGENRQGLLSSLDKKQERIPDDLVDFADSYPEDEFEEVLKEVNEARKTIMQNIILSNKNLRKEDLPRVQKVFADMQIQTASSKELIEDKQGNWVAK